MFKLHLMCVLGGWIRRDDAAEPAEESRRRPFFFIFGLRDVIAVAVPSLHHLLCDFPKRLGVT